MSDRLSLASWPLRKKLLLLALVVFLPAAGILVSSGLEQRRLEISTAENNALLLVQSLAAQQEQITVGIEQMLSTLAQLPQVQRLDAQACSDLFRELRDRHPFYSAMGAVTPDGSMFANAKPFEPGSINISDQKHIKNAIKSLDFSVGEYTLGRLTNVPALYYSYPVLDAHKNLLAIVYAGFALDEYARFIRKANLPENSAVVITDHKGVRLFRLPENDAAAQGKPVPDHAFKRLSGGLDQGIYEGMADDGIYRMYFFKQLRLREGSPPYLYMVVGIARDKILHKANLNMYGNLLLLGLAAFVAASLAWFFGNVGLIKPIEQLVIATQRLGGGEVGARTGLLHTSDELGHLAQSFDTMASLLETKEKERKQAEQSVIRLNRLYAVLSKINEAIIRIRQPEELFLQACRIAVEDGGLMMAWVGLVDRETLQVKPAAGWGVDDGYLDAIALSASDIPEGHGPTGIAIKEGIYNVCSDWQQDRRIGLWREKGLARGYRSSIAFPLHVDGRIIGAISLYSEEPHFFSDEEIRLLKSLAENISYALAFIEQEEQRRQMEEALRKSEERYRSILQTAMDGCWLVDMQGRLIEVNEAYSRMSGYSKQELLTMSVSDLEALEVPVETSLHIQKAMEQGTDRFESRHRRKDGSTFEVEISTQYRPMEGGQFVSFLRNITERRTTEDASRTYIHFLENLERIDRAIKQETDVEKMLLNVMRTVFEIFVCDRAWLFYPCDPEAPSFRVPVEITRPEYPGAKDLNLEVPMSSDVSKDLRDALASEDPLVYTLGTEKPVNTLTAQLFAVQAQMFMAIYPKIGKPWTVGMHQCSYPRIWSSDEQKLFKEIGRRIADGLGSVLFLREVKENEERFRATFEQAAVGMAHVALDGRWLRVNRKLCDIIGYSRDELLQKTLQDILQPHDLNADMEYVRQVLSGEISTYSMEKRSLRKDRSVVWINLTVSIVRRTSGDPDYFIFVIEDITERKQAEEERRRLEERLQRAEKMEALGTLAGGVAHDLNNVLGIVVGYSELLLLDASDSTRSEAIEILKGGQRAAAIVQDLLTLARRGIQSKNVLNLNNILLECQRSPQFANAHSFHPDIKIKTDFEVDLLNLSGSSVHLEKSFLNLVSNAAEAMPSGGTLTIKTRNRYLDKPVSGYDEVKEGDYVTLSVTDTGEGIPAADLKRIFEPFYTKKVMGRSGTGLGLAVVWGTVKDHLGYINVESEEGKGTTFTLYFPVTREELTPEQVSVSAAQYMGHGESLLVVDDVKEQRELAAKMLTKLNYRVTTVPSGEEAVKYLERHAVELIVLDMIMDPGMDGLDTYSKILQIHPHQKAIIVSGFSETERVAKAQALGAGAYVKKPYVLEKLGLAVREELDRPV